MKSKKAALGLIAHVLGAKDLETLLENEVTDTIVSGACTNAGCEYVAVDEMEPDARDYHCEYCGTFSVRTSLDLAGLI